MCSSRMLLVQIDHLVSPLMFLKWNIGKKSVTELNMTIVSNVF